MKTPYTAAVSVLAGIAIGAGGVAALHAEAKPPAYVVGEINVSSPQAYQKEYVSPAAKAIVDGGGKYLVRGGKSVSLYGEPPRLIAVMAFESLEKAQAAFDSAAYKDAKTAGDKYATFRIYAVEGVPQ